MALAILTEAVKTTPVRAAIEATPAAAVVVVSTASLDWWLKACGIGFLVLQAAYLAWRWRRDIRRDRKRPRDAESERGDL